MYINKNILYDIEEKCYTFVLIRHYYYAMSTLGKQKTCKNHYVESILKYLFDVELKCRKHLYVL